MRVAVVGHVEWMEFVRVESVPRAGEIVQASESWEQAGGGGAVSALQLAALAGACDFFTAFGADELGLRAREELTARGVRILAGPGSGPQRRASCFVDVNGERTITVIGDKLRPSGDDGDLPWEELAGYDAVFFCSGDVGALRKARSARVVVATTRELQILRAAEVELDAIVGSGEDEGERYHPGDLDPAPALVVTTAGRLGGWAQPGGPYQAAPAPGPIEDAYGSGDCFAAGLTFGLASGLNPAEALGLAARCGAAALTGRGVFATAPAPPA